MNGPIKILISAFLLLIWVSPGQADTYKIATTGDRATTVIGTFQSILSSRNSNVDLQNLSGIGRANELISLLEQGHIDVAVVPFQFVPELRNSPFLMPFLAEDALKFRQTLDSEVGAIEKSDVAREGFRVLEFWHTASTILSSRSPIRNAMDLRGLKIRQTAGLAGQTLEALGATPVPTAFAEAFSSFETGNIDSLPIPFNDQSISLGYTSIANQFVDRQYQPELYAVLITKDKWASIPYEDQHHLADAATAVAEGLVIPLQQETESFRKSQIQQGAVFTAWNDETVNQVQIASLEGFSPDAIEDRNLAILAYANAAAVPDPTVENSETLPEAKVELLFATDRQTANLSHPETAFSSIERIQGHSFGSATVHLSNKRKYGSDLEDVSKITKLNILEESNFWKKLDESQNRDVVVFIHGYNNSFADSMRRGATIKQDIASTAIVISYTWPSDGELLSYGYDESSTDTALQNFESFMDKITKSVPTNRINIIAHSMGSRLLTKYLAGLPDRGFRPATHTFKNIIFAAADISQIFFKQKEETPRDPRFPLSAFAANLTTYASKHDRPLKLSQKLHGKRILGLADQSTLYLEPDITAVDASKIDPARFVQTFTFATRHSYVFDKRAGVRELSLLLTGTDPGDRPGMNKLSRNGLDFWALSP